MFPKNPNPTFASTQTALSEQASMNPENLATLRDKDFELASMHPVVRAEQEKREAASLKQPLSSGWLNDVNSELHELEPRSSAYSEARYHEPTYAERLAGAEVKAISEVTPYIVAIRRSPYATQLAGTPEDFDLAL